MRVAQIANDTLDYLTVHARHAQQRSSDMPQWAAIREIKQQCTRIPIIGNGNVFSQADACTMLQTTGCDGVLIARGALHNPWIFSKQCLPSADVVQAAHDDYNRLAELFHTKDKYSQFHNENFARLSRVAQGDTSALNTTIPRNKHIS